MIPFSLLIPCFLNSGVSEAQVAMDHLTRHRVEEVVSVFENSTLRLQYAYIEKLNDGRGYTAGRMGATTATGDLLATVQRYLELKPQSAFQKILPLLIERARTQSGSVRGLESLPPLWRLSALDPDFIRVQDELENEMIYIPALRLAQKVRVQSHLGFLCLYDTLVQHGEDELVSILTRLKPEYASEEDLLADFLDLRFQFLYFPGDPSTREEWRESAGRIFALKKLLLEKNLALSGPFSIRPFDEAFIIP